MTAERALGAVVQAWRREASWLDRLPPGSHPPVGDQRRRRRQALAQQLQTFLQQQDWFAALGLLTDTLHTTCLVHFRLLEAAFPLMTPEDRAFYLRYVWCRAKLRPSAARVLKLFHAASTLRDTVPAAWRDVVIYRGIFSRSERRGRHLLRRGVSWTTSREVGIGFTESGLQAVRLLGKAVVPRDAILAYFHDPDTVVINGVSYPVHDYHEHECVVDPVSVTNIEFEVFDDRRL